MFCLEILFSFSAFSFISIRVSRNNEVDQWFVDLVSSISFFARSPPFFFFSFLRSGEIVECACRGFLVIFFLKNFFFGKKKNEEQRRNIMAILMIGIEVDLQ